MFCQEPGKRAGEYCSASRSRGCIHTQDAVGRHRREAIESNVAKSRVTVRTPARGKKTGWEFGENRAKNQPHLTDHKAALVTEHRDDFRSLEINAQGVLNRPERFRGNAQTTARRRLHTARANRKQVNGLSQGRHREVREIRWNGDESRRKIVSDRFTESASAKRRATDLGAW